MGSSGRHRHDRSPKTLRIGLLSTAGLAVAALIAAVVAFGGSGSSTARASARDRVTADSRRVPDRPSRDETRTPLATPSEAPADKPEVVAKKRHHRPEVLSRGDCEASFYGTPGATASGETFDPSAMTAAHKTLPLGSKVRVTNRRNDRSVIVRINDRGPFTPGRCLDLSTAAMRAVGGLASGVIPVTYEVLARL